MQAFLNQAATLDEVLAAREKRAQLQADMRAEYHMPIVSLSINMPGPVKYTEAVVELLYTALAKLRQRFTLLGFLLLEEKIYHGIAGPGAILAVGGAADIIKKLAVELEDENPAARLLDIDVFTADGKQLSRTDFALPRRTCLVCKEEAVLCMRSQKHAQTEVIAAAHKLLAQNKIESIKAQLPSQVQIIGATALEAMLLEVACTPAPGLVDRHNSGAHRDMDFFTFVQSSSVLSHVMQECALAGWRYGKETDELLPLLRRLGLEGEKMMFAATHGVNTQKGILFLMGIVAASAAAVVREKVTMKTDDVLKYAAKLCEGIVARELEAVAKQQPQRPLTAGERYYIQYGITGIRGEIAAGLPSVKVVGLPSLRQGLAAGLSLNDALVHALLALMAVAQDTTILNRHDITVLREVQAQAKEFMAAGGMLSPQGIDKVKALDQEFIAKNISPGGAADLLAVTYFLHAIEGRLAISI